MVLPSFLKNWGQIKAFLRLLKNTLLYGQAKVVGLVLCTAMLPLPHQHVESTEDPLTVICHPPSLHLPLPASYGRMAR